MHTAATPFTDRAEAGRALAARLADHAAADLVVLGLPRGGVAVAAEVATALSAELDVLVVRKIGVPWYPELAMGAIAAVDDDLVAVRLDEVIEQAAVDEETFRRVCEREVVELRRREAAYREGRPPTRLGGRPVIVVDDGLATGSTMRAAIAAVRRRDPTRLTVAVPVGSPRACHELAAVVDVRCLWAPASFSAVSQGYERFEATSDDEVRTALSEASHRAAPPSAESDATSPSGSRRYVMTSSETGNITGTKDKDYNIIWFTEACLGNALRMETYIADAERDGDNELADFFRRAQADSRKGAEEGKKLLASRLRG
jgi:predicted phosphoribosyltransferase